MKISAMAPFIRYFSLVFLLLWSASSWAQMDPEAVNQSPYGVIYNHLYYLQPDSYDPAMAARSFRDLPAEEAQEMAIMLKQILDGRGIYVDIHRLPENFDYIDSISGQAIYIIDKLVPLIYVERIDSAWYYSRTTVKAIPELHKETYPFDTRLSTWFTSPAWQMDVLGVQVWQWLGIGVLLLLSVFIYLLFSRLIQPVFRRILKPWLLRDSELSKPMGRLARLFGLMVSVKLLIYFLPVLELPPHLNAILVKSLGVVFLFFIIFLVNQVLTIIFHYLEAGAKKTSNTLDDQLLPVVLRIARGIVWALGVIYILDYLGVNITALLAGISLGGLALALAAQDTVKNFFGSIMIFVDKPFQIGDWIHFDDVDGVVEEVGVRSTRIRTFANSLTYVPNGYIANKVVDNYGLRVYRRYKTTIGITYDTSPELIDLFVEGIRELIRTHPTTRKDSFEVHLNSFGDSSLNILIYAFFAAPSWTDELEGRHDIMNGILRLAAELGVRFAFPTQTIHVEDLPGGGSLTPQPLSVDEARQRQKKVLDKLQTYFHRREVHGDDKVKPLGGE